MKTIREPEIVNEDEDEDNCETCKFLGGSPPKNPLCFGGPGLPQKTDFNRGVCALYVKENK